MPGGNTVVRLKTTIWLILTVVAVPGALIALLYFPVSAPILAAIFVLGAVLARWPTTAWFIPLLVVVVSVSARSDTIISTLECPDCVYTRGETRAEHLMKLLIFDGMLVALSTVVWKLGRMGGRTYIWRSSRTGSGMESNYE